MRKDDLESEQAYIDSAYSRLDSLRASAQAIEDGFDEVGRGGTHQAKFEKDAAISLARNRIASLNIGSQPLCFGRLDVDQQKSIEGQTTAYVGRLAISDENQEPIVIDWRAPVAEPFYRATPVDPLGVIRRRHFHMSERKIVRIDDEVFDEESAKKNNLNAVGEAALLSAISKERTGRMGDIVATIQKEQDLAIRASMKNVLIVTGGPGTGKTAVALHRAAYLLYTYRDTLVHSGVLLIGPSSTFLKYIDEVLPSLGEDDVYLRTIETLRSAHKIHYKDEPNEVLLKGNLKMVGVIKNALNDRQHPLPKQVDIWVDGYKLILNKQNTTKLVRNIQSKQGTHNQKRPWFVKSVLRLLSNQYQKQMLDAYTNSSKNPSFGSNKLINAEVAQKLSEGRHAPEEWIDSIQDRIRHHEEVKKAVERMWPIISGAELYHDLCSFTALINSAGKSILTDDEKMLLKKNRAESIDEVKWSDHDIALIDEAESLCGPVSAANPRKNQGGYNSDVENASRVIGELGLSGYMTASELAQRYGGDTSVQSEANDEIRTFGHILIDEAQDLTPMQWRMVARRCPTMSMTIVGDFAQASLVGACNKWDEVLDILNSVNKTNSETVLLSVNYRTPAEVMDLAHDIMREVSPELAQTEAVRDVGTAPIVKFTDNAFRDIKSHVDEALDRGGNIAIIATDDDHTKIVDQLSGYEVSDDPAHSIDSKIAVMNATSAKGLEFDHVIVIDPHSIVEDSQTANGWKSLFVTCTRATQTLTLLVDQNRKDKLAEILSKYN